MNQAAHGVRRHHPQEPQHHENNDNGFKHMIFELNSNARLCPLSELLQLDASRTTSDAPLHAEEAAAAEGEVAAVPDNPRESTAKLRMR